MCAAYMCDVRVRRACVVCVCGLRVRHAVCGVRCAVCGVHTRCACTVVEQYGEREGALCPLLCVYLLLLCVCLCVPVRVCAWAS